MKTIEYRVMYAGSSTREHIRVQARSINSGFTKVLQRAKTPLGSGVQREIASIEFWAVV